MGRFKLHMMFILLMLVVVACPG